MMPNMNSRQMQQMMRRMGMQQEELDASQVIIITGDKKIVFDQPQVSKINMMGQQTFQIVGEPREEAIDSAPDISEDDIQTVIDQTNVSKEEAIEAITKAKGDLAEAILELTSGDNN